MNPPKFLLALLAALSVITPAAAGETSPSSPYGRWKNGPPRDDSFFPIAVWLQNPNKAKAYHDAGFNTFVGLWRGPTEEQLAALKSAGLKLICSQNEVARKHLDDPTIIAWMHGDEPDNAQSLGSGKGYGPPILPQKIIDDYQRLRAADPSRPVLLNLGQGVAWDNYIGRGVRRNHPEDYPEYVKGCDIASFDIYPVVHPSPEITGKLWYVPHGVERLLKWAGPERVVWNCIECTRISHPTNKPTPRQVRAEVWMSLTHGSRGLIYFVHEWKPRFNEAAILSDPEMLAGITAINQQITRLAPVLNSPPLTDAVTVSTENKELPVAAMARKHGGTTFLFAVGMRDGQTTASFTLRGLSGDTAVEVIDENRSLQAKDGVFRDRFEPWEVHLYRVKP
ncbi:MAG: hypothetical protein HZA90_16780 [Verrucomicrobia bacterium]|nr:hypothetical protein [Verrucomicrobiota bacterium]